CEIFTEWSNSVRHRIKESTYANYQMKAAKHLLPNFGEKFIDCLESNEINCFIQMKLQEGLSSRYVSDIIILMKTVFKYAVQVYNVFNPMDNITLPKKKKTEISLLDDIEQAELQKYISNHPNYATLGTALAITTGIRIGELCALQWCDIDLKKRVLTVRKTMQRIQCDKGNSKTKLIITDPKSESSRRSIPIPDCMMGFLSDFKGRDDEFILTGRTKPIEPRTMQYRFKTILKNANLPSVHFHALRHCFASFCISLGFDIKALSELLGHSSVEITLNRYVHSSFEQKRAYMNRINMPLLAKD
uniref:site-specific integrase n=1 Tax=Ruminococcus flavefaciens TaxID=1265 RepID=UPI0026EB1C1D